MVGASLTGVFLLTEMVLQSFLHKIVPAYLGGDAQGRVLWRRIGAQNTMDDSVMITRLFGALCMSKDTTLSCVQLLLFPTPMFLLSSLLPGMMQC